MMAQRTVARAIAILFVLGLVMPVAVMVSGFGGDTAVQENRLATSAPPWPQSRADWTTFPNRVEAWFGANFGLRDGLIRLHNLVLALVFRVSPSSQVVFGDAGWMFFTGEFAMFDYRVVAPFLPEELDDWARSLAALEAALAARGTHLLVVVAPNAQTIYPEYVPKRFNRLHAWSRLDALLHYLPRQGVETVLDLRPALRAAKRRERVYHQTDSHWNARGAFAAATTILDTVRGWYPRTSAPSRDTYEPTVARSPGGDLAGLMGLRDVFTEETLDLRPREPLHARPAEPHLPPNTTRGEAWAQPLATERPDGEGPRALVYRDSFATALTPFLSEAFSRVVYVHDTAIDPALVEREHPDVVILEIAERRLMTLKASRDIVAAIVANGTASPRRAPTPDVR